ncbi:hypothetical protein C2W62_14785 [Candidatus Entotheonella serta]|nr:hypothetical protein C2W62_14785 [Candidatus Entotheonella serta]
MAAETCFWEVEIIAAHHLPLFIEEMTKAIIESGYLTNRDTGGVSQEQRLGAMIPETLQDSLMSRLDRLESAKVVAQYASVIGRQFSGGGLG